MSVSVSEKIASAGLFRQSHWLGLVIIYLHTNNYQNIPSGLKVIHHIQFPKILPRWGYFKTPQCPDFVLLLAIVEVNIYTKFHKDSIENVVPRMKKGFPIFWPCDLVFDPT